VTGAFLIGDTFLNTAFVHEDVSAFLLVSS